jgi:hypothetical protein
MTPAEVMGLSALTFALLTITHYVAFVIGRVTKQVEMQRGG